MNERDKEIALQAGDYVNKVYTPPVRSKTPGKIWEDGHVGWYTQFTAKLIQLVRADAMETATRAANESWTLLAKALVLAEREACAKVCENEAKEHERNAYDAYDGRYDWKADGANDCADAIRARGNT